MSFAMLYVGWLNYLMITVLPVTILCAILLSPVFATTNALVSAIFVAMYNVLAVLFMFTIGTFFNRCESLGGRYCHAQLRDLDLNHLALLFSQLRRRCSRRSCSGSSSRTSPSSSISPSPGRPTSGGSVRCYCRTVACCTDWWPSRRARVLVRTRSRHVHKIKVTGRNYSERDG